MEFLTQKQFEALPEEQQETTLSDLATALGIEIEGGDDDALVDLYLNNLPDQKDSSKTSVVALESVRFKDDDGTRRGVLKGDTALVGIKVAKQLIAEGLAK